MAHKNSKNWSPYTERKSKKRSKTPLSGKHKAPVKIFSLKEADLRIEDYLSHHGFKNYPSEKRQQLAHFYRLLMENQKKQNFTRLVKLRDITIKHFVDCLLVPQLTDLKFPLLDLGTGPGFPGIPLKIEFPDERIFLAEGVQKRVEFLKDVREELNLKNLDLIGRFINNDFAYPIQGVITRAVEEISNTLNNISECLQPGGKVYFMKGPNCSPELIKAQKNHPEFELLKDISYQIPNTPHQRRLIVYTKTHSSKQS